jgi:apolipoprotein N-acyltransferase
LLFLSDYPAHIFWLQLVALLPWLWVLSTIAPPANPAIPSGTTGSTKSSWAWLEAAAAGLTLGLFYTVPLLVVTAFPWLMAVGLGVYITGIWILLSLAVARVLRWPGVSGAFAAGSVAVLAEWVSTHAVPIWGTAQSFVRVWSAAPWAIQFVEVTGTLGIVFALVTLQALVVRLAVHTADRRAHAIALLALVAVVSVHGAIRWFEKPSGSLRVGAVGWNREHLPQGRRTPDKDIVQGMLLPLVKDAIARGAVLVVSPETGFEVNDATRKSFFDPFHELAREHRVAFAIGYFDNVRNDNRIALIDETGALQGEYRKTHLIPMIEDYTAGDGTRLTLTVQGYRVGGMICQDDNFTDLASGYGRDGVPIVAVPTNDWGAIKDYHFENSRMRPLENRYAVVRGTTNGISAIVSARGEVLAKLDHFDGGPGAVVADLPLLRPGSLNAWARHGFAVLCAGLLALFWGLRRRKG